MNTDWTDEQTQKLVLRIHKMYPYLRRDEVNNVVARVREICSSVGLIPTHEAQFDTFLSAYEQVTLSLWQVRNAPYTQSLELTQTLLKRATVYADSGPASTRLIHLLLTFFAQDCLTEEQQEQIKTILLLHEECLLHKGIQGARSCPAGEEERWSVSTARDELEPYCLLQWKLSNERWIIADTIAHPTHYALGSLTAEKVRAHCELSIERIEHEMDETALPKQCGTNESCGLCTNSPGKSNTRG